MPIPCGSVNDFCQSIGFDTKIVENLENKNYRFRDIDMGVITYANSKG